MFDTSERKYRLYMKAESQSRFSAVDWQNGVQVGNLIHASVFSLEEAQRVQPQLELPENSQYQFDWRTLEGRSIDIAVKAKEAEAVEASDQ